VAIGVYGGECAEKHTVFITDRGGAQHVAQLVDLASVEWSRVRDDISEAYITIRGGACSAQASTLAGIEPKRHEMVIYRGEERVWEGPIMRVGWHSDWVEIAAHDVIEYVFGTPLTKQWNNAYPNIAPVTTRMQAIMEYEMKVWERLSPPANVLPYLVIHHFPNEAKTSAVTTPYQMTIGEHLDNYARSGGIDYTVVGRAIHIWDTSRWIGQTRRVTEADFFDEVIITAYGADLATKAYVVANDGRYGVAASSDAYYGPWAKIFTVYDEDDSNPPTQADLDSQAKRNLSGRNPVPVEVRVPDNSSVRLSEGFSFRDMVPGVRVPLLATLNARQMSQMQKLNSVKVTEDAEGENVQVVFVPATRPDSEDEEKSINRALIEHTDVQTLAAQGFDSDGHPVGVIP
jgi:hypothetical protein